MTKWFCCKCNAEAEEVYDIKIFYGEIDLPPAVGLRCPDCNIEFLESDFVVNELNPAEQMLEGK